MTFGYARVETETARVLALGGGVEVSKAKRILATLTKLRSLRAKYPLDAGLEHLLNAKIERFEPDFVLVGETKIEDAIYSYSFPEEHTSSLWIEKHKGRVIAFAYYSGEGIKNRHCITEDHPRWEEFLNEVGLGQWWDDYRLGLL